MFKCFNNNFIKNYLIKNFYFNLQKIFYIINLIFANNLLFLNKNCFLLMQKHFKFKFFNYTNLVTLMFEQIFINT